MAALVPTLAQLVAAAPADGSAAPPRLDLDGNGTVLAGDVLALLSLWAVACP